MKAGHTGTKVLVRESARPDAESENGFVFRKGTGHLESNGQMRRIGRGSSGRNSTAMILPTHIVFFTIADDCMRHSPKATFSVKQETVWQRFESS